MADTLDLLTLVEGYRAINDEVSATAATGGVDRDAELAQWITAVSRRIDDRCGPVVQRTVTDEAHDGGRHAIWLANAPIASITSLVEYDGTTATTLTAETNAAKPDDGYLLDGFGRYDRQVRRRSGNSDANFPAGRRNVVATYSAGRYASTAAVDEKFKLAAGSILRRLWHREGSAWARGGDPFAEAGAGSVGFFKAVDPMITEFLSDEVLAGIA